MRMLGDAAQGLHATGCTALPALQSVPAPCTRAAGSTTCLRPCTKVAGSRQRAACLRPRFASPSAPPTRSRCRSLCLCLSLCLRLLPASSLPLACSRAPPPPRSPPPSLPPSASGSSAAAAGDSQRSPSSRTRTDTAWALGCRRTVARCERSATCRARCSEAAILIGPGRVLECGLRSARYSLSPGRMHPSDQLYRGACRRAGAFCEPAALSRWHGWHHRPGATQGQGRVV